jgi:hypothetical protein
MLIVVLRKEYVLKAAISINPVNPFSFRDKPGVPALLSGGLYLATGAIFRPYLLWVSSPG